ncbi:uncharacterized protein LOC119613597 [Lucilia sericata]|uniref:uncharacterized protein LOC119613597 n=1 Tax=Lucilia sericata TaxID=13632 RepID=UPI0018A820DB|nr:uncharacterized protein LOC119613597 [Lucilia sericata]
MVTSKMYLYGILIIVAGIVATKAEADCNRPPPFVELTDCCDLDIISEDIKAKCDPIDEDRCFFTCVVNETAILVDGEIQDDIVDTYLNEVFDDSEKMEYVRNKLMSCYEQHKKFVSNMPDHGHHDFSDCGPKHGGKLIGCVHVHSLEDCPDSYWSNTAVCNEARDHFIQCERPHHGPHHHKEDVDVEE